MTERLGYFATGRRKEAAARVGLLPGKGSIIINGRPWEKYFLRDTDRIIITQPLEVTNNLGKFDIKVKVRGGGLSAQAGAVRHGIAQALVLMDYALRPILRKGTFLTRDPRMKERKKYGQKGARKRFQWTKR